MGDPMRRVGLLLLALASGCGNVDTTPPTDEGVISTQDADEDGIADADDLVPCAGVRLLVDNAGVEDAQLSLNGEPVVTPDAFPTGDMVEVFLNVAPGTNSIEIESSLTGGESLHVIVEPADKSGRWLDETLTSSPSIADASFGFDVTASCAGY